MDQPEAVRKVAQVLNGGTVKGRSTRLARLMGVTLSTVQSWLADGNSAGRKRGLSGSAKRLLFLSLALHEAGHDLDQLRKDARRLAEEYLGDDD